VILRCLLALLPLGAALLAAGCSNGKGSATTRPATAAERSDKALRDPFRYSPDWSDADVGADDDKLDRRGLERDLGHVIMP
jgi:hypothetical protein